MNFESQASKAGVGLLATARLDRAAVGLRNPGWFSRSGHPIRLAAIFQIPVGYQDETGFHHGEQYLLQKTITASGLPESEKTNINDSYHF